MPTAREGAEFLKARLGDHHSPADLPDLLGSAGFAVVFSEMNFVVVSVDRESPEFASITFGVLKDVSTERGTLLEYCNTETANNPGMPMYSHGSDVLIQQRNPIALVARIPEVLSIQIDDASSYGTEQRESWLRQGIVGEPYAWNGDDVERLYRKATTPVL